MIYSIWHCILQKIKIYINSGRHQKLIHYKMIKKRSMAHDCMTVLGLARTGLIFTGIQEGAQPGGGG